MDDYLKPRTLRVPYFEIELGGEKLSKSIHGLTSSITFNDTASEASTLHLSIQDPDYQLIDDVRIVRETPMKIWGGWVNNSKPWITGFISTIDIAFPADGAPTLDIMVMDESFMMDKLPRYDIFKDMYSDEIAAKIALRYGLKFEGDRGPRQYKHKVQSKETDIKFLRNLAQNEWFIIRVENGTLQWKKRDFAGTPEREYWYRRPPFDILSFNPRMVQADRVDGYMDTGINPATGEEDTGYSSDYQPPDISQPMTDAENLTNGSSGPSMQYDPKTGTWHEIFRNNSGGR